MTFTFTDPQINYYVEDVEVAVRFYTQHFGFVETFRTPQQGKPDHVELKLGPLVLGLASREAGRAVHGLPLGAAGNPRAELVLWTDDVDAVYTSLVENGVPSVRPPHDFLSSLRSAWVLDPDGNPVEIVTRRVGHAEAPLDA